MSDTGSKGGERTSATTEASVRVISDMIKDLEVQLDRMIAINEALEGDLETERTRRQTLKRKYDALVVQTQRVEADALRSEQLVAEMNLLKHERTRLAQTVSELEDKVREAVSEREKQAAEVERLRAGRQDALEEVRSVEAQFERAMQIVSEHKARLTVIGEEYEAVRKRVQMAEGKLSEAEEERDALLMEVDESRSALEDIRTSLVDACVISQDRVGVDDD